MGVLYCKQHCGGCYALSSDVSDGYWWGPSICQSGYCTVPTKKLAEAFLAMMQLMSLRQAWIGDWEPDWRSNVDCDKYCIIGIYCNFEVLRLNKCRYPLSFPTREMAEDFMNCFKDLLEIAKPLI